VYLNINKNLIIKKYLKVLNSLIMSTCTAGDKVNEGNDVNIDEDDDNMHGHSSKQYLHTGRNEENIEVRGINTEHSRKDPELDKSFEREQDEGISLKATKIGVSHGNSKDNKVHAENGKEKDDKKKDNPFEKKITYLNATRENLLELKYNRCRIGISDFMRSKPVDISIIILIIMYTLLVIVYLAVEDEIDRSKQVKLSLQILELAFLAIF
jgi:hypothetical protein